MIEQIQGLSGVRQGSLVDLKTSLHPEDSRRDRPEIAVILLGSGMRRSLRCMCSHVEKRPAITSVLAPRAPTPLPRCAQLAWTKWQGPPSGLCACELRYFRWRMGVSARLPTRAATAIAATTETTQSARRPKSGEICHRPASRPEEASGTRRSGRGHPAQCSLEHKRAASCPCANSRAKHCRGLEFPATLPASVVCEAS